MTSPRSPGSSPAPPPPRVSDLAGIFPRTPELQPFLDLIIASSSADPDRRWTGSGELGTVGDRIVDPLKVARATPGLGSQEATRLVALFRRSTGIVEAVAREDWEEVVGALLEQGGAEEGIERSREAELWYLAAFSVARDRGSLQAPRALRLAARSARKNGDLHSSAIRYEEAWRTSIELGRDEDRVIAAMGRGNVEVDRGSWREARLWYERALELIGASGPPRRERWQLFQNLAIVARRSGEMGEARDYLERARAEGGRLADPDAAVEVENGWGQLVLAAGDPRSAELHFRAALEAARSPVAHVTVGVNLGEALLLQGRSLEAGEEAREAEARALAGGVTGKLPEVYRLLAQVARARGEGEAFVLLNRALDLIRERRLPDYEEALTREALGGLRLAEGDLELGLAELDSAMRIYRELGMGPASERVHDIIRRHAAESQGGPVPGVSGTET